MKASLVEHVLNSPKELLKLSVPSLVYAVQNNMAFLALSNLDAAVYQVGRSKHFYLLSTCHPLCHASGNSEAIKPSLGLAPIHIVKVFRLPLCVQKVYIGLCRSPTS